MTVHVGLNFLANEIKEKTKKFRKTGIMAGIIEWHRTVKGKHVKH